MDVLNIPYTNIEANLTTYVIVGMIIHNQPKLDGMKYMIGCILSTLLKQGTFWMIQHLETKNYYNFKHVSLVVVSNVLSTLNHINM
jgi:hypothetical protein